MADSATPTTDNEELRYQIFKILIADLRSSRVTSNRMQQMLSQQCGDDVVLRITMAKLMYRIVSLVGHMLVNEHYAHIALDNLREVQDKLVREEEVLNRQ